MLVVLLCSSSLSALDPQKSIGQYVHNVWQIEQGLPQNSIHGIVQTHDGYLWLGTEEGLARFDGVRFVVFDRSNTPELKSNIINALLQDHNGILWIATRGGGINRFENGKFSSFTSADGLASDAVSSLCEAPDGSIWIGTFGGGVSRFHHGKFTNFTTNNGLANNTVVAVEADHDGNIWIGTRGGGLSCFRNHSFRTYTTKDGLLNNVIYTILRSNSGSLWIGTGGGLNLFQNGKFSSFTTKDGLSMNIVYSLFEDRDGNLWVGTFGEGLNRFRDGKFSAFTRRDGLSGDLVWSLYEDRERNLWVGTSDGGLNRFKDGKFTTYTTSDGLSDNNVRSVFEDHEGNLWVATGRGISSYRNGKWTRLPAAEELTNDLAWAVYEDRKESLWIAGDHTGLSHLEIGDMTRFKTLENFPLDFVRAFYEDHEGNLWVGTRGNGLHRFRDGQSAGYTTANGLSNNTAWAILEDHENALWIGTDGGGLNRFKDGSFTSFTTRDGLSQDSIVSLHEDQSNTLWIGTWGGGLNRFKNGKFTSITSKDGLFDDVLWVILEDGHENLWMSSNKGVFQVSLNELNAFCESKIKRVHSTVYGTSDGMKSRECNGASQPAGWRTHDGKLWFPTVEGAAVIDANHIEPSRYQPPVLIEEFIAGEKAVPRSGSKLAPGTEKFEFHYTALSFSAPEKVRFKYRLDGLDRDWVDAGIRRTAFYTHIPAGSYRFRVKACNEDGVWNENAAMLSFVLQPHFYETRWFFAVSALFVLFAGWRLHKYRLTRALEFERIRMRIATDLHDDIGAGLSQIAILSEVLKQENPGASRSSASLTTIAESSRELIDSMSDIVWSVNPEKDHVSDLSLRMRRFAVDLLESSNISVDFHTETRDEHLVLDPFRRREIYLIFKESINNIVRHSGCSKVQITLQRMGSSLFLQVEDDGKGYDGEAQTKGFGGHGVKSMKSRAEKIGGAIEIKTGSTGGASVTLTIPL